MKLVEDLTGTGRVYLNSELLPGAVAYGIQIWQEMPGGIPGLRQIHARLTTPIQLCPWVNEPKGLALEIEDGRRMGFVVTSSLTGDLANLTDLVPHSN